MEEEKKKEEKKLKELSKKEKYKLKRLSEKYRSHEKLLIASHSRKTIRYIERNTINFPNQYMVLKNKIIDCSYKILDHVYRANILQDKNEKKEILVCIGMLNLYLEEGLKKDQISNKKSKVMFLI